MLTSQTGSNVTSLVLHPLMAVRRKIPEGQRQRDRHLMDRDRQRQTPEGQRLRDCNDSLSSHEVCLDQVWVRTVVFWSVWNNLPNQDPVLCSFISPLCLQADVTAHTLIQLSEAAAHWSAAGPIRLCMITAMDEPQQSTLHFYWRLYILHTNIYITHLKHILIYTISIS